VYGGVYIESWHSHIMRVLLGISMKKRCSSAADTSRTQGIVVTSPCRYIKGKHIGGLLTVCRWLGNMASHKYFNYTWLINTKRRLLVPRENWLGYGLNLLALYCCIHIAMLLSHDFSNDNPAKYLVC